MPQTTERPVKVSRRSGFDKTFRNTFTANTGTLVPALVDEVPGNSKLSLKINAAAVLPPLVSDTYMNVRLKFEAFAVPHRLLIPNWDEFYADFAEKYVGLSQGAYSPLDKDAAVPLIRLFDNRVTPESAIDIVRAHTGVQSLADYLGFTNPNDWVDGDVVDKCSLPFVLYHLVWQEWYRNPRVQRPAFARINGQYSATEASYVHAANLIYTSCYFASGSSFQPTIRLDVDSENHWSMINYLLADNTNILDLRQRNFGLDFFTAAMPEPQLGPAVRVQTNVTGEPADSFSIASLRAQNSLQQFRDRNGLTSPRYQQQVYARTGAAPSDGMLQRPALIGVASYDVYSHGVTATQSTSTPGQSSNPFAGKLGQRGGNAFAGGSDMLIEDFHAKEPMYILVMCSLVPDVSYSQVMNPVLGRYIGRGSVTDIANDILQNVGPEPIYNEDVSNFSPSQNRGIFAYTDRYSRWMIRTNEIHGKFKYGENMAPFVLQRFFSGVPEFGSEFLEIPKDYLDDVLVMSQETLGFSYWVDMLLEWKVSMPLQEYAIPTLQDPGYEHGKTIYLRRNGQLL